MDGTYKVCMSVKDQVKHGRSVEHAAPQNIRRRAETHVVMTVMSKSGCLIDAIPLFSEKPGEVVKMVASTVGDGKAMVKVLKTDRATEFDIKETYTLLPNLEGMLADPQHPSINLEISRELRMIFAPKTFFYMQKSSRSSIIRNLNYRCGC